MVKQKLNVDTSIVDLLKSKGLDSSQKARADLAVKEGLVGSSSEYLNLASRGENAAINIELINRVRGLDSGKLSDVSDIDEAKKLVNEGQAADIATETAKDLPPSTEEGGDDNLVLDTFSQIQEQMGVGRPEAVNLEEVYRAEVSERGVEGLEDQLTSLEDEQERILAAKRQRIALEREKPVAENIISGRVSRVERAENERLDAIQRQIRNVSGQLNTRYKAIDTIMKFKQTDFENATKSYNTQFTQSLQMFNLINGVRNEEKSEEERQRDNARANAQIIYNSIKSGNVDPENLTPQQKADITKLEIEGGLPVGFYENLRNNTEGEMLYHGTREVGGKKFLDIIMKDKNGRPVPLPSILLGGTDPKKDTPSPADKAATFDKIKEEATTEFDKLVGDDGFISIEDYRGIRNQLREDGLGSYLDDFDKFFAERYLSQEDRSKFIEVKAGKTTPEATRERIVELLRQGKNKEEVRAIIEGETSISKETIEELVEGVYIVEDFDDLNDLFNQAKDEIKNLFKGAEKEKERRDEIIEKMKRLNGFETEDGFVFLTDEQMTQLERMLLEIKLR